MKCKYSFFVFFMIFIVQPSFSEPYKLHDCRVLIPDDEQKMDPFCNAIKDVFTVACSMEDKLKRFNTLSCGQHSQKADRLSIVLTQDVHNCLVPEDAQSIQCNPEFINKISNEDPSLATLSFIIAHEFGHLAQKKGTQSQFSTCLLLSPEKLSADCVGKYYWESTSHYEASVANENKADEFANEVLKKLFLKPPFLNAAAPDAGIWSLGASIRNTLLPIGDRIKSETWPISERQKLIHARNMVCGIRKGVLPLGKQLPSTHPDMTNRALQVALMLPSKKKITGNSSGPWNESLQKSIEGFSAIDNFMLSEEAKTMDQMPSVIIQEWKKLDSGQWHCSNILKDLPTEPKTEICEDFGVSWSKAVSKLKYGQIEKQPSRSEFIAMNAKHHFFIGENLLVRKNDKIFESLELPCQPSKLSLKGDYLFGVCPSWEGIIQVDKDGSLLHWTFQATDPRGRFPLTVASLNEAGGDVYVTYQTAGSTYVFLLSPDKQPKVSPQFRVSGCNDMQQRGMGSPWVWGNDLFLSSIGEASLDVCSPGEKEWICFGPEDKRSNAYIDAWDSGANVGQSDLPFVDCGPGPRGKPLCYNDEGGFYDLELKQKFHNSNLPSELMGHESSEWCVAGEASWLQLKTENQNLVLKITEGDIVPLWLDHSDRLFCSSSLAFKVFGEKFTPL